MKTKIFQNTYISPFQHEKVKPCLPWSSLGKEIHSVYFLTLIRKETTLVFSCLPDNINLFQRVLEWQRVRFYYLNITKDRKPQKPKKWELPFLYVPRQLDLFIIPTKYHQIISQVSRVMEQKSFITRGYITKKPREWQLPFLYATRTGTVLPIYQIWSAQDFIIQMYKGK